MDYFFTSDEHYNHNNIIVYCDRPFDDAHHMNDVLIAKHNEIVKETDVTVHLGDFSLHKKDVSDLLSELNGRHIFVKGNHDYWTGSEALPFIHEEKINDQKIVCCHYSMQAWNCQHHGSWHLFGHSHGTLKGMGKSIDVGVDTNDYYPYSFDQIADIMKTL